MNQSPSHLCLQEKTENISKETASLSENGSEVTMKENTNKINEGNINEKIENETTDQDPFHIIVESESGTLLKHDSFVSEGEKVGPESEICNTYEILQVQNLPKSRKDECSFEPRVSLGEWEDALYARIMKEALSFAPSLTAPVQLPSVDESPTEPEKKDSPFVSNLIHRRSYALATRKESFEGKHRFISNLNYRLVN